MKRAAPPPTNHAEHRDRWAGLVQDIHHAVASDAAPALSAVAERALAAESCWTMIAPFPRGLVCRVMTRLAYAWARQADAPARAALAPLLMASVGLVDQLLAETAEAAPAPSMPPAGAIAAESVTSSVAIGARLPYRED